MHSINAVVFLFTVSSFIDVVYTQDEDQQEYKLVCLNDDPYVLNVPKLFNVSFSGEIKVVHSNVDNFTEIKQSCNGIEAADLEEIFQKNMENYKNNIVEEVKENHENVSIEMDNIKKEISVLRDVQIEDKKNMENLKEKLEDVHDILTEIKDTVKEIGKNVSFLTSIPIPESCKELYTRGQRVTGVYKIQPKSMNNPFDVLCEMKTRGSGGWTVIQNRFDGSQDFDLSWQEYKDGFGNISREFWLGLEKIYQMTRNEKTELLVVLEDRDRNLEYAHYREFGIGPEISRYTLTTLQGFEGYARDSLSSHVGNKFSTKDSDRSHDIQQYRGGWWLRLGTTSNLNGLYLQVGIEDTKGIFWDGADYSRTLAKTRMLIRPV